MSFIGLFIFRSCWYKSRGEAEKGAYGINLKLLGDTIFVFLLFFRRAPRTGHVSAPKRSGVTDTRPRVSR